MNIGNGIENLSQIFPSHAATGSAPKVRADAQPEALSGDTAQLSEAGTRAAQTGADADVRLDKVASIQSALAAGTYQVPAADVAQKIIGSMLAPDK